MLNFCSNYLKKYKSMMAVLIWFRNCCHTITITLFLNIIVKYFCISGSPSKSEINCVTYQPPRQRITCGTQTSNNNSPSKMARCVSCTIIGSNVYDESNEWIIFKYEVLKWATLLLYLLRLSMFKTFMDHIH